MKHFGVQVRRTQPRRHQDLRAERVTHAQCRQHRTQQLGADEPNRPGTVQPVEDPEHECDRWVQVTTRHRYGRRQHHGQDQPLRQGNAHEPRLESQ